jgi:hypothetical protein
VMTVSGLTLGLLGSLAVVTFWGNPAGTLKRRRPAKKPVPQAAPKVA